MKRFLRAISTVTVLMFLVIMVGQLRVFSASLPGVNLKPIDAIDRFKQLSPDITFLAGDMEKLVPTIVTGTRLSTPLAGANLQEKAINFMTLNKDLLGIKDASRELVSKRLSDTLDGGEVVRMQQVCNGIPVVNGEVILQLDKNGQAQAVGGLYFSQLQSVPAGKPAPALSKEQALEKAKTVLGNKLGTSIGKIPVLSGKSQLIAINPQLKLPERIKLADMNKLEPADAGSATLEPELMYMVSKDTPLLVYKTLVSNISQQNPQSWQVYINANTGEIVDKIDLIENTGWDCTSQGTTMMGENVTLNSWYGWTPATHVLFDRTKYFYGGPIVYAVNLNNTDLMPGNWVSETNGNFTATELRPMVSAQHYSSLTVDYFAQFQKLTQPWKDNRTIIAMANFGNKYNNAFYDGSHVVFGSGDGTSWTNFAKSLDIVAHEITHGVTEKLAGLEYRNQSGALNESYSDVFGMVVEYYKQKPLWDWKMGEDSYTPNKAGDALRYMDDPTKGGQPKHIANFVTTSGDNGGVHTNSGIPNYVFYRAVTRAGGEHKIGAMSDIWFRTLDLYLTPTSNFAIWAFWTRWSAKSLYPELYTHVDLALKDAGL